VKISAEHFQPIDTDHIGDFPSPVTATRSRTSFAVTEAQQGYGLGAQCALIMM